MKTKFFGTDGLRGEVNTFLTPEISYKLGLALATYFKDKNLNNTKVKNAIFIANDPRESCDMLIASVSSGIMAGGVNVVYGKTMPSSAVSYLVTKHKYLCGVMVTASHNDLQFNGLKVFDSSGAKLTPAQEIVIEKLMKANLQLCNASEIGNFSINLKLKNEYLKFLANNLYFKFYNKRIVIGAAFGSGASVVTQVFNKEKFINVTFLGVEENGLKINSSASAVNTEDISKVVLETKSDYGFALDGDADRVVLVLRDGRTLTGDELIFLLAVLLQEENRLKNNSVVATYVSNTGLDLALAKRKIKLYKTNVGDKYVIEKLLETGASLGGEKSGHIIFPEKLKTGDGALNIALILNLLETYEIGYIDNVLNKIRLFDYVEKKIKVSDKYKNGIHKNKKLNNALYEAESILASTGRVLLRPSGTEPIIRVIVEGLNSKLNLKVASSLANFIEEDSATGSY